MKQEAVEWHNLSDDGQIEIFLRTMRQAMRLPPLGLWRPV